MLGTLRGLARTPIALVFILLLAASFAVWGLSDVFVGRAGGAMATAGDRSIYQYDLERRIGYYLSNERAEGRFIDQREATQDGTVERIFAAMSEQLPMLDYADDLGVSVSRKAVARRIAQGGLLANELTGKFERSFYAQFLQQRGETRDGFETALHDDLTMRYLRDIPSVAVIPPDVMVRMWSLTFLENRTFAYVVVPESDDIPEPDDAQIAAYYASNPDQYTTPERRAIAVWSLSADDYLHTIALTDADIEHEYTKRGQDFASPETREIIEVLATEREPVELLADRINTGTDPDEAFAGLDQLTQSSRIISKEDVGDDAALEAAFRSSEGSALIPGRDEDNKLWKTLIVLRVIAGKIPPLAEIRDTIIEDARSARAEDAFATNRDEFLLDLIGGGYPLDDIVDEIGGVVLTYPPIDAQGKSASGETLAAPDDEMREDAFALAEGETSGQITTDDGISVVQVMRVDPQSLRPLDAVRDEIRAAIIEETRENGATEIANAIAAQSDSYDALLGAATEAGLTVHTFTESIQRYGASGNLDTDVVNAVFSLGLSEASVLPRPTGAAAVLWLTGVEIEQDKSTVDQYLNTGRSSLGSILGADAAAAAESMARRKTPLRINQNAFDTFSQILLGRAAPG